MEPPVELDGATVVCWAYSPEPFFVMPDGRAGIPICGLAVAQYSPGKFCRFSCDRNWETQNDSPFASVQDALHAPSGQYEVEKVRWTFRGKQD